MRTERSYKKVFSMVICIVMLIACLSVTAYAEGFAVGTTVFVNVETKLNLRDAPQGNIIGGVRRGESVTIMSEVDRNGYYRIMVDKTGEVCYAYGEYLTLKNIENIKVPQKDPSDFMWIDYDKTLSEYDDPDLENASLLVVSDAKLNMRKGPAKKYARVKYLYYGAELVVVSPEIKNGYVKVKDIVDGKVGYVDTRYVTFKNPNEIFDEDDYDCGDEYCCWCQGM